MVEREVSYQGTVDDMCRFVPTLCSALMEDIEYERGYPLL